MGFSLVNETDTGFCGRVGFVGGPLTEQDVANTGCTHLDSSYSEAIAVLQALLFATTVPVCQFVIYYDCSAIGEGAD